MDIRPGGRGEVGPVTWWHEAQCSGPASCRWKAVKAGIDVSVDKLTHHFAGGNVDRVVDAHRRRADINLTFERAAAIDPPVGTC